MVWNVRPEGLRLPKLGLVRLILLSKLSLSWLSWLRWLSRTRLRKGVRHLGSRCTRLSKGVGLPELGL